MHSVIENSSKQSLIYICIGIVYIVKTMMFILQGAQTLPAIKKRCLKQEEVRDVKKFKLDHR